MEKSIFREKSVEGLSTPDQLNDYIRVVKPSVWVTFIAIIVLLVGVTIWGFAGGLNTGVRAVVISDGKTLTAYINEQDKQQAIEHNTITINDKDFEYSDISIYDLSNDSDQSREVTTGLGLKGNEVVYSITVDGTLPEGEYEGRIITGKIHPMSFVTN